jgi:predicted membrane chloride channel (bestrophin family)
LPAPLAAEVDRSLAALGAVQAGCERIASTPIPFAYTLLLHRTARCTDQDALPASTISSTACTANP